MNNISFQFELILYYSRKWLCTETWTETDARRRRAHRARDHRRVSRRTPSVPWVRAAFKGSDKNTRREVSLSWSHRRNSVVLFYYLSVTRFSPTCVRAAVRRCFSVCLSCNKRCNLWTCCFVRLMADLCSAAAACTADLAAGTSERTFHLRASGPVSCVTAVTKEEGGGQRHSAAWNCFLVFIPLFLLRRLFMWPLCQGRRQSARMRIQVTS